MMIQTTIQLTDQQHRTIKSIALLEGERMATLIRHAVREFIDRYPEGRLDIACRELERTEALSTEATEG